MARFERIIQDFARYDIDEIGSKWNMDDDDWEEFGDQLTQAIDGHMEDLKYGSEIDQEWLDTMQSVYKELTGGTRG